MEKKILYVDLDGVVADFDLFIRTMCSTFDEDYTDEVSRHAKVDEIATTYPDLFKTLRIIDGALSSIFTLSKYYDIYFLSTPMFRIPQSYSGKRIWVAHHFGPTYEKRLILTHRKDLCIGDYLVDDRTANGAGEFKGQHIHFRTEEFQDWLAVENYLVKQFYNNKESILKNVTTTQQKQS